MSPGHSLPPELLLKALVSIVIILNVHKTMLMAVSTFVPLLMTMYVVMIVIMMFMIVVVMIMVVIVIVIVIVFVIVFVILVVMMVMMTVIVVIVIMMMVMLHMHSRVEAVFTHVAVHKGAAFGSLLYTIQQQLGELGVKAKIVG